MENKMIFAMKKHFFVSSVVCVKEIAFGLEPTPPGPSEMTANSVLSVSGQSWRTVTHWASRAVTETGHK